MKILVLSRFDEMWGPIVHLKAPEEVDDKELGFLTELMDLEEKDVFYHDLEGINTINMSFEVPRRGARGRVETFMASIALINEEVKPKYFMPVLNEFVEGFKNIKDVYKGIQLRKKEESYSEQKAEEIKEFFQAFYKDLPEETVLIDKNVRILVFGLPNAGKTTLVKHLKTLLFSRKVNKNKTAKKLFFHNLTMTTHDLPVKEMLGKLWNHYIQTQDGFIFVIDASDESSHDDAMMELQKVSTFVKSQNLPLLVLFNKMDVANKDVEDLLDKFSINQLKIRPFHCFFTVATGDEQVFESFEWLANKILRDILRNDRWK